MSSVAKMKLKSEKFDRIQLQTIKIKKKNTHIRKNITSPLTSSPANSKTVTEIEKFNLFYNFRKFYL